MSLKVVVSATIVVGWIILALIAPVLNIDVATIDLGTMFKEPSFSALFGSDDLGRDIFSRVLLGASVSCSVAFAVVAIAISVGTLIGVFVGWYGGIIDLIGVRVMDIFLAFPGILLAIALAAVLGPGIENVLIALSLVSWVGFARLARAQTLSVRQRDHVIVARALGTPAWTICWRHVVPLILAPLIVEATFAIAAVIIAEAGLSFLGLGVQPPLPSWGAMIKEGTRYLLIAPHMVFGPGMALFSLVIAINVLGDGLRDMLQIRQSALQN